jgi:hypothetical protein
VASRDLGGRVADGVACHTHVTATGAQSESSPTEQPAWWKTHALGAEDRRHSDLIWDSLDEQASGLVQGVDDIGCVNVEGDGELLAASQDPRLQRAEERKVVTSRRGLAGDRQLNAVPGH